MFDNEFADIGKKYRVSKVKFVDKLPITAYNIDKEKGGAYALFISF